MVVTTIAPMTPLSQSQGGSRSPSRIPPIPRPTTRVTVTTMRAPTTAPNAVASSTPMRRPNAPLTAT